MAEEEQTIESPTGFKPKSIEERKQVAEQFKSAYDEYYKNPNKEVGFTVGTEPETKS